MDETGATGVMADDVPTGVVRFIIMYSVPSGAMN